MIVEADSPYLESPAASLPDSDQPEQVCPFCCARIHPDWLLAHFNARHQGWPEGIFRLFWGEPSQR